MKNRKQIGIVIMIAALFILGIGIGLKFGNSDINNNSFTIVGIILNAIGLFVLISANKKVNN